MTKFQKNRGNIRLFLSPTEEYSIEDIFNFTREKRELLGFYIREVIDFNDYIIEACMPMNIDGRVFHISHRLSTFSSLSKYSRDELMSKLEDVDNRFFWLIKALLTIKQ